MTHLVTGGGVAASHDVEAGHVTRVVATATNGEWNTLTSPLIPVACWRVNNLRFDFGSSVVRLEMAEDVEALAKVREQHRWSGPQGVAYPRLSVFGHADPVGNDDHNKQLSGRRAKAVYAMFTRRVELWEQIYNQPLPGDDWRQSEELKRFARERGITAHRTLFLAYMDAVCGPNFRLHPATDFLSGTDAGGKGDYQGCSEFNPVRLLRTKQAGDDPARRDEDNAPNRRVVVFMFAPDAEVIAARWPCPRAGEGTAGCHKRFWSDGQQRRSPSPEQREYVRTKDTFACRFYDRLARASPCEGVTSIYANWVADPVKPIDSDTSDSTQTEVTFSD